MGQNLPANTIGLQIVTGVPMAFDCLRFFSFSQPMENCSGSVRRLLVAGKQS